VSDPKRVSDLLKSIIRDVRTESRRSDLTSVLAQVLGAEHSPHCQVTGFRNGRLTVEVDSAPLFAELSGFRREQIRQNMNELLTKKQIAQIAFRMGGTGHV